MKNTKYHTVGTILKYHTVGTILKYHTVGTIPKYNRKIVEIKSIQLTYKYMIAQLPGTSIKSGEVKPNNVSNCMPKTYKERQNLHERRFWL